MRYLSFTFDDCCIDSANKVDKILSNFKATFYIVTGWVNPKKVEIVDPPNINVNHGTFEEWKKLSDNGHDIGSHTVSHIKSTDLNIIKECEESLEYIKRIHVGPYSFASPGYSVPVNHISHYFDTVRVGHNKLPIYNDLNNLNMGQLVSWSPVEKNYDLNSDSEILDSIPDSSWTILTLHALDGVGYEPISSENLEKLVQIVVQKGFVIKNVKEVTDALENKVTAHIVVKNEDLWIWFVIQSIIDFVDTIFICDSGSTDNTLEIVNLIKSDKIKLIQRQIVDPYEDFTKFKNELISFTKTYWWMCVDGDEVYSSQSIKEMIEKLSRIPKEFTVLSTRMKYFVENLHRVSAIDVTHRYAFVRNGKHIWSYGYGDEILTHPQPTRNQRLSHWYKREGWDFDCFHTSFLKRSSNETDEVYQRKHRQYRAIAGKLYNGKYGYSGPYPEVFYRDDIPEIVKKINPYIEQIYKSKEEFGM